jgi:hypothetical protein
LALLATKNIATISPFPACASADVNSQPGCLGLYVGGAVLLQIFFERISYLTSSSFKEVDSHGKPVQMAAQ